MQQLDIFNDSRDRMLLNDLATALDHDDAGAAALAATALRIEFPNDPNLAPAALLIESLAQDDPTPTPTPTPTPAPLPLPQPKPPPLPDLATAVLARQCLSGAVTDAARTVLGSAVAGPWLVRRWRALAPRAEALPFNAQHSSGHAAALWLAGAAWDQAADAVQRIESWRRIPQPLMWMTEARFHQSGLDAIWPLMAELCWLSPARLPALLKALADPRLDKAARRFEADLEVALDADGSWWPAWLLVDQPLLAEPLAGAEATQEQAAVHAFKLVQSLLHLEQQGRHHDLVAQRRRLKDLNPALFAIYMKTR